MQSIQAPLFNLTFEVSFLHIEKTRVAGTQGEDSSATSGRSPTTASGQTRRITCMSAALSLSWSNWQLTL